ncbi:hypothetical protein GCM10020220_002060 [Nonomuraea rubra]
MRTYAGQTQVEVTPCGAPSSATTLENPSSACLAVVYADLYGEARSPCTDEMFTNRPQPLAYMPGSTRRAIRNGASTITLSIVANTSGGNSSIGATCWNPALFTTMSTGSSGSAATKPGSLRSATTAAPPTSAATFSADSARRSTTSTLAPAAASRRAHAAPMPPPAPVTSAVRPVSSFAIPRHPKRSPGRDAWVRAT